MVCSFPFMRLEYLIWLRQHTFTDSKNKQFTYLATIPNLTRFVFSFRCYDILRGGGPGTRGFDVAVDFIRIRKTGAKKSEDTISTLFLPDQYYLRILSSKTGERKESTDPSAIMFDTVGSTPLSWPVLRFFVKLSSIEN